MHVTCTEHAWDMNVTRMGCAWAVHQPCIHGACTEAEGLKETLVTRLVMGATFWCHVLLWVASFGDEICSG